MFINVLACPNPSDTPNPAIVWSCLAPAIVTVAVDEGPLLDRLGAPPPQPAADSAIPAAAHQAATCPNTRSARKRTSGIASMLCPRSARPVRCQAAEEDVLSDRIADRLVEVL